MRCSQNDTYCVNIIIRQIYVKKLTIIIQNYYCSSICRRKLETDTLESQKKREPSFHPSALFRGLDGVPEIRTSSSLFTLEREREPIRGESPFQGIASVSPRKPKPEESEIVTTIMHHACRHDRSIHHSPSTIQAPSPVRPHSRNPARATESLGRSHDRAARRTSSKFRTNNLRKQPRYPSAQLSVLSFRLFPPTT